MSSLLRKPGSGSSASPSSSMVSSAGFVILYILVGCILVAIVYMLLGYKLDISWVDIRSPYTRVMSRATTLWPPTMQFTNLTSVPNAIPGFVDTSYTTLIECVLYNTRSYNNVWNDGEGPYRHIYHRGSNELLSSASASILGGCSPTGTESDKLPPQGLPRSMNPGVFVDPNLNDLLIFIDTTNATRESIRITDLPLDIPFRIGIVVNQNILEIYLNCKLEVTKLLKNPPRPVEHTWYGLSGSAAAQAQIQNLSVWKYPLLSSDITHICTKLDFAVKRTICDAANLPTANPAPVTTQPADLGFGAALAKCT